MAGNVTVGSVQFNEFDGEHDIGDFKFHELSTPVYTWKVGGKKSNKNDRDLHLYMGSYFYAPDDEKCVEILTVTPNGSSDGKTPMIRFNGRAEFTELDISTSALSGTMIVNGSIAPEKLQSGITLDASITGTAKRAECDADGKVISETYVNKANFLNSMSTKLGVNERAQEAFKAYADKNGNDIIETYCFKSEFDALKNNTINSILERLGALESAGVSTASVMGVHTASNDGSDSHYISLQPRINPQYVVTLNSGEYKVIAKEFDGVPDMTYTVNIIFKQTSGGGGTVVWDGNIRWANGVVPTIPTEDGGMVTVTMTSYDSGITWLGKQGEVY